MPDLEEPGWPNLQGGADPGAVFMNAFAAMSNVNARKRALEEKLTKMDQDARFREMKFELDKDKMERDSYFKSANLQRAYDIANMNSVFKDRQLNDAQGRFEDRISRKDADLENAGKYRDEMNAWGQKYSDDLGGTEAQMQRSLIEDKYQTVLGTPEGGRQARDFNTRMNAAQAQAHKNADVMHKQLDFGSKVLGVDKKDWSQGDEVWQKNDEGKRFYAFQTVTPLTPGSTPYRKYLTEKEVDDLAKSGQGGNVRYSTTIDEDTYQTMKDLAKQVTSRSSASGSLRGMPAPRDQSESLPRNPAERIHNKVYQSAVGPVIWDGENLIKQ